MEEKDKRHTATLLPPQTLAYMGDAVFEQYVRTRLVQVHGDEPARKLHLRATKMVCASAQAHAAQVILDKLLPDEQAIFRRGRNAKIETMAKHASVADYRWATGLEAVLGYLYLAEDCKRLQELLRLIWEENEHGKNEPTC